MNIPFVDLKTQYNNIKEEIKKAINEVLESQKFIQGEYEKDFSTEFARIHGSQFAVGCSNGTSAITVALRSLGIGPGDEVITQANSFFATPEAIVEVGATPVFVDCEDDTYSISITGIEECINEKTKAIIPVHLYGNPASMIEVKSLADKYNLKVIEDCAQAHLAHIDGKAVGTFGEFGTFSFYPGKNLGAYGDAGAVISQDRDLHQKATMHINHGRIKKYEHDFCAGNFRMDGIQAAILKVKLKYIEQWTEARIQHAKRYDELLSDLPLKSMKARGKCVYHLYPIEVENRDLVMEAFSKEGIGHGVHYPIPLHLQPALSFMGHKVGDFPISERTGENMT